jgi:hypothetical protein
MSMKPEPKVYTEDLIYEECIRMHAYRWMKEYQDQTSVQYLEFNGGALITHFCSKYGAHTVAGDLDRKIIEFIS